MPTTTPSAAERVARTLQRAHSRAEDRRDEAAEHLRRLTEQHAHAVAILHDAHAEEQALAAALAEAGGRTWSEEQAEQRAAKETRQRELRTATADVTAAELAASPFHAVMRTLATPAPGGPR